jgi:hypothetical protein
MKRACLHQGVYRSTELPYLGNNRNDNARISGVSFRQTGGEPDATGYQLFNDSAVSPTVSGRRTFEDLTNCLEAVLEHTCSPGDHQSRYASITQEFHSVESELIEYRPLIQSRVDVERRSESSLNRLCWKDVIRRKQSSPKYTQQSPGSRIRLSEKYAG